MTNITIIDLLKQKILGEKIRVNACWTVVKDIVPHGVHNIKIVCNKGVLICGFSDKIEIKNGYL